MKRLNQLQKNYLTHLLDFAHDYNDFENIGFEGQIALIYMSRNYHETSTNHEKLVNLVDKFIKNYRKQKEANQ